MESTTYVGTQRYWGEDLPRDPYREVSSRAESLFYVSTSE